MNAWNLSSSGLTRESSFLKSWMPDQVGHGSLLVAGHVDLFVIPAHAGIHGCRTWMPDQVGHDSLLVAGHDDLSVIPAQAGIHACITWMPDQVGHDSLLDAGHDSLVVTRLDVQCGGA